MKMGFRWFGTGHDAVSLGQIRQIGYVDGVIATLYDIPAGEAWQRERVRALREEAEAAGLPILGIESVNVSDDIKAALPGRDRAIDNYIASLQALGEEGIRMVCYNFMPVFDWTRSQLAKPRKDGSTVLAYDQRDVDRIRPEEIFERVDGDSNGFVLPGWEPERLSRVRSLFEVYADVDAERLLQNLAYFLTAIGPVCEKYDIRMAIHPDDPAWPVFGLPRIVTGRESLLRLTRLVDKPYNGVTLCTGSLGSNPQNDIPDIIRALPGRVHFVHARNVLHTGEGQFEEACHMTRDGSLNMLAIIRALKDIHFDGVMRPDHGRALFGERAMPGYGLYDRALGAAYLQGLWEAAQ